MTRPPPLLWLMLSSLVACHPTKTADSGPDSSETGGAGTSWYADLDADGYGDAYATPEIATVQPPSTVGNANDCDDSDPDVHPGADERCNHKDDDCDGTIDEDPVVAGAWYPDADGDRYGDASADPVKACEDASGFVSDHTDCDDTNAEVYPHARENCGNGLDDDCDGAVDEDDFSGTLAYPDADGDGYGAAEGAIAACLASDEGFSDLSGDCDDSLSWINPAADEVCDGVDNNCDGLTDDASGGATSEWYRDEDGDGWGEGITPFTVAGCDAPADGVLPRGDCDDGNPDIYPGAAEICGDGVDDNCDTVDSACTLWGDHGLAEADAAIYGGDEDGQVGYTLATAGDADGDGNTDLWVGAPYDDDWGGRVYLVPGTVRGSGEIPDLATAWLKARAPGAGVGYGIADAGDANGDGYEDVWAGAQADINEAGAAAGSASLVLGPFAGEESLSDAELRWMGVSAPSRVGESVAGGQDLDGDGRPDAVISAYWRGYPSPALGSAYVVYGDDSSGDRSLADANVEIQGSKGASGVGFRVAFLGDTDGDGQQDIGIVVGLPNAIDVVTTLPSDGTYAVDDVGQLLCSSGPDVALGDHLSPIGDVNGDGYDDFAAGAWADADGGAYAGAVWLVEGPVSALSTLDDATAKWIGTDAYEYVTAVAGGADMDGDGALDVVIGGFPDGMDGINGAAWLVRGPFAEGTHSLADADASFMGEFLGDAAGNSVAMLADANGDGYADVAVAAVGRSRGAAYLILGAPF